MQSHAQSITIAVTASYIAYASTVSYPCDVLTKADVTKQLKGFATQALVGDDLKSAKIIESLEDVFPGLLSDARAEHILSLANNPSQAMDQYIGIRDTSAELESFVQQVFLCAVRNGDCKAVSKLSSLSTVSSVMQEAILVAVRTKNIAVLEHLHLRASFSTNNFEAARVAAEERLPPYFISLLLQEHYMGPHRMSIKNAIQLCIEKGLMDVLRHLIKFYVPPSNVTQPGDQVEDRLGLISRRKPIDNILADRYWNSEVVMQQGEYEPYEPVPTAGSDFQELISAAWKSPNSALILPILLQSSGSIVKGITPVLLMRTYEETVQKSHFKGKKVLRDALITMAVAAEASLSKDANYSFEYLHLTQIFHGLSQEGASHDSVCNQVFSVKKISSDW